MSAPLLTPAELADVLRITETEAEKLRVKNQWPHQRFGRFLIRYTVEQVEQIKTLHAVTPTTPTTRAPKIAGQTSRSAARH